MPGQRVDTKEAWEAWVVEEADREGILKETCRSMRRRVDVDHSPAAPARYIPTLNPKPEAGPTTTKSRNDTAHLLAQVLSPFIVIHGHTHGAFSLIRPLPFSSTSSSCPSPSSSSTSSCSLSSATRSSWQVCATPPQKRVRTP